MGESRKQLSVVCIKVVVQRQEEDESAESYYRRLSKKLYVVYRMSATFHRAHQRYPLVTGPLGTGALGTYLLCL